MAEREGPYDLVVVGGGIVGAGIARDAVLRGLSVALFEKDDFAAGTTSRSTRLIHGGLRYLEHLDFGLVYEALRERRLLIRNAPHLVDPVPFLFPVYKGKGRPYLMLWVGMVVYDILSLRKHLPHHLMLGSSRCLELEETLRAEGLRGGFLFYDAQCRYPERLCLETLLDAQAEGALIANHSRVVGLERDGDRVTGVRVRHESGAGERIVAARAVVNTTGPWVDEFLEQAGVAGSDHIVRSKGIHLVTPSFTHHALIMESEDAKRVFFAIPWAGYTLLGTTDTPYVGDNDTVEASEADIDYLLHETHRILNVDLRREDILFTTAGLRALPNVRKEDVGAITRRHQVVDHAAEGGPEGLFTVVGGKITTYREIAEDVVERIGRSANLRFPRSRTRRRRLPGAARDWSGTRDELVAEARAVGLDDDTAQHLGDHYGVLARDVLERVRADPGLARRLADSRPEILAEVDRAVDEEWGRSVEDVLLRRLPIGLAKGVGLDALDTVAERMAERLGWDQDRVKAEKESYRERVARMSPWEDTADATRGERP